MLQISEIVKKTEEMFDLFNEHFYNKELTRLRYKNIDLPDMLKEVEMPDFHFNVPADGKITFEISYAQGVLPEIFPEARAKMTRAEKAEAKEAAKAVAEQKTTPEENTPAATETPAAIPKQEETALAIIPEAPATEPEKAEDTATENEATEEYTVETNDPAEETAPAEESGTMEISYNVPGPAGKSFQPQSVNFSAWLLYT